MVKLLINALLLVVIVAVVTNVFGAPLVAVVVDHCVQGIKDVADIAEKIGQDGTTTHVINILKDWLAGVRL